MKEVSKLFTQTGLLPLRASKKGKVTLLLHLSSAMQATRALIHLSHLLHMLAPLTWDFTLILMVISDSKVPLLQHLLHLLQSSQGLAWQMRSRPPSLVIQILVWQVALMHLFKILLCYHSLTHPSTLD
jgi:hypothetical protein